ncbi:GNAT family N-acetyltransferase [Aeromicrobium phragmitis]|uniref:GNAT family N-acetyltransferase n=1 Tax=Aeromicrobium phragmitis TaxID=2478914 RepID=UPI001AA09A77|nr:GNAT family N-acetyltransferase [Aeromicrobium phragmitis]
MSTNIQQNEAASRFEIHVDDELAGFADYERRGDVWEIPYTRVFDHFGGRGLGHELVVATLTSIAEQGGQVLPTCPFVPRVIADHPEFIDLVPEDRRARYGF